jgi:pimeloyl-ACP methyl ester carboxylesterase
MTTPSGLIMQTQLIHTSQLRMHILEWAGQEPTILMLHPNQMNAHIWTPMIKTGALHNRIIAPDQRGHGDTDYPDHGYSLADYLADDVALLDQLGLERVIVVAAATGANVALLMATQFPQRVRALVVINPALTLDAEMVARMQYKLASSFHHSTIDAAMQAIPFSERWTHEVRRKFAERAFRQSSQGGYEWRISREGVLATYAAQQGSLWDRLHVTVPTLIIRASQSPVFSGADAARLKNLISNSSVVTINDGGQLVMMDFPTVIAAEIRAYLYSLNLAVHSENQDRED